jgi:Lrp/AsnC family transcriptional regulator, leucine-responsive regulatory protein
MTRMVQLDEIDRKILAVLRKDGRAPVAQIAATVQLSPAPVARRIDRLRREGVILGFVAVVDDRLTGELEAFTEIRLHGATQTGELAELVKQIPEVQEFFTIAGDPDAMVRIRVRDVDHLQRVVNAMRSTGTVTGTKTLIAMYRWTRAEDTTP